MEIVILILAAVGLAIWLLWRARRATSPEGDTPTASLSADTRNKRLFRNWTNMPTDDGLITGNEPIPRVPREEGHGKDGGG